MMSPQERQRKLIERYAMLPGPQERLNALLEKYAKAAATDEATWTDEQRVHGCQSRVYVAGEVNDGTWSFRFKADSMLVRGLVGVLCDLYTQATTVEVIQTEPEILQCLGIWQILSPTRQKGLLEVRRAIKEYALREAEKG